MVTKRAPTLHLLLRLPMAAVAVGAAVVRRSHLPTTTPTTFHLAAVGAAGAAEGEVVAAGAVVEEGAAATMTQTSLRRRSCGNCSPPIK